MSQQEDTLHGGDVLKGEGWEANHRQPLFDTGMDLKLHPGVRSSRNYSHKQLLLIIKTKEKNGITRTYTKSNNLFFPVRRKPKR